MFLNIFENEKGQFQRNNRRESRRPSDNKPVLWRKSLISPWCQARLRDVSELGVGLIVPKEMQPEIGHEFDMYDGETKQRTHCHVLRTAPWKDNQTLVNSRISYTGPSL